MDVTESIPPSSSPSPGPPPLVEYVALVSYERDPFQRTSALNFLQDKPVLKGHLDARVPSVSTVVSRGMDVFDFPDCLEYFVYPSGIKLHFTTKAATTHSFVFTMANGERLYGYCYTSWGPVEASVLSVVRMQMAEQLMNSSHIEPGAALPKTVYAPTSIVLLSRWPFIDSFTKLLQSICHQQTIDIQLVNAFYTALSTYRPRRQQPTNTRRKRKGTPKKTRKPAEIQEITNLNTEGWPPSTVALMQRILVVCSSLSFYIPIHPYETAPYVDASSLSLLFAQLEPKQIILMINLLLCEISVLVISEQLHLLTPVIESLAALLYPLRWPYIYIPLLPLTLSDFFEAPQPFIIGTHRQSKQQLPAETVCAVVDLDNNTITVQNHPAFTGTGTSQTTTAGNTTAPVTSATASPFIHLPSILSWRLYQLICTVAPIFTTIHPNYTVHPPANLPVSALPVAILAAQEEGKKDRVPMGLTPGRRDLCRLESLDVAMFRKPLMTLKTYRLLHSGAEEDEKEDEEEALSRRTHSKQRHQRQRKEGQAEDQDAIADNGHEDEEEEEGEEDEDEDDDYDEDDDEEEEDEVEDADDENEAVDADDQAVPSLATKSESESDHLAALHASVAAADSSSTAEGMHVSSQPAFSVFLHPASTLVRRRSSAWSLLRVSANTATSDEQQGRQGSSHGEARTGTDTDKTTTATAGGLTTNDPSCLVPATSPTSSPNQSPLSGYSSEGDESPQLPPSYTAVHITQRQQEDSGLHTTEPQSAALLLQTSRSFDSHSSSIHTQNTEEQKEEMQTREEGGARGRGWLPVSTSQGQPLASPVLSPSTATDLLSPPIPVTPPVISAVPSSAGIFIVDGQLQLSSSRMRRVRKGFLSVFISLFRPYKQCIQQRILATTSAEPSSAQASNTRPRAASTDSDSLRPAFSPSSSFPALPLLVTAEAAEANTAEMAEMFDAASFLSLSHPAYQPMLRWMIDSQTWKYFLQERVDKQQQGQVSQQMDWFDLCLSLSNHRASIVGQHLLQRSLVGVLWKFGSQFPSWIERWFELGRNGLTIRYFSISQRMKEIEKKYKEMKTQWKLLPNDPIIKASLDRWAEQREKIRTQMLKGAIKLEVGQTSISIPNDKRRCLTPWVFELQVKQQKWLFCAEDTESRDDWIQCIRARTGPLRQSSSSTNGSGVPPLQQARLRGVYVESQLQQSLRLLREEQMRVFGQHIQEKVEQLTKNAHSSVPLPLLVNAATIGRRQSVHTPSHSLKRQTHTGFNFADSNSNSNSNTENKAKTDTPSGSESVRPLRSLSSASSSPAALSRCLLCAELMVRNLDIRDRVYRWRTYRHCFVASEAVAWLLKAHMVQTEEQAIQTANQLLQLNIVQPINKHSNNQTFKNDDSYYQFVTQNNNEEQQNNNNNNKQNTEQGTGTGTATGDVEGEQQTRDKDQTSGAQVLPSTSSSLHPSVPNPTQSTSAPAATASPSTSSSSSSSSSPSVSSSSSSNPSSVLTAEDRLLLSSLSGAVHVGVHEVSGLFSTTQYSDTFRGIDALEWLVDSAVVSDDADGIRWCNRMLSLGAIRAIPANKQGVEFKAHANALYRFSDNSIVTHKSMQQAET